MSDTNKAKRATYSKDNSERNKRRQANRIQKAADKIADKKRFGNYVARGTARAQRRAAGDFKPVNEAASLAQAPQGRFARSL